MSVQCPTCSDSFKNSRGLSIHSKHCLEKFESNYNRRNSILKKNFKKQDFSKKDDASNETFNKLKDFKIPRPSFLSFLNLQDRIHLNKLQTLTKGSSQKELNVKLNPNIMNCFFCSEYSKNISLLLEHYNKKHEFVFEMKTYVFESKKDLENFKSNSFFTDNVTMAKVKVFLKKDRYGTSIVELYRCNFQFSHSARKYICPCYCKIINRKTRFVVEYQKNHTHDVDINKIRLQPQLKKALIDRIRANDSIWDLKQYLLSFTTDDANISKKISALSNNYLYYLKRKYSEFYKLDSDAANSFYMSLEQLANERKILLLTNKKKGEKLADKKSKIKEEDFIVTLTSEKQISHLEKFPNSTIMVDSTFNTNRNGLFLITMSVLNEYFMAYPIMYILASSERTEVLEFSFSALKKYLPFSINPRYFMSDMYNAYFNGFAPVFGNYIKHIYCTWHVQKAFQGNLISRVKDPALVLEIQDFFNKLNCITDIKIFETEFGKFLNFLKSNCFNFYEYFVRVFKNIPQKWAMVYRLDSAINTNMGVESFFSVFKNRFLKNQINSRLDFLLQKIVMVNLYMYDRYKKLTILKNKEFTTYKMKKSQKNHLKISDMDNIFIRQIDENSFSYKEYSITKLSLDPNFANVEICGDCNIGFWDYRCSCPYWVKRKIICKHIHLLCSYLKNVKPNSKLCGLQNKDGKRSLSRKELQDSSSLPTNHSSDTFIESLISTQDDKLVKTENYASPDPSFTRDELPINKSKELQKLENKSDIWSHEKNTNQNLKLKQEASEILDEINSLITDSEREETTKFFLGKLLEVKEVFILSKKNHLLPPPTGNRPKTGVSQRNMLMKIKKRGRKKKRMEMKVLCLYCKKVESGVEGSYDNWLSCFKCCRWAHLNCIEEKYNLRITCLEDYIYSCC